MDESTATHGFKVINGDHTRVTASCASAIDLVITNQNKISLPMNSYTGLSDHHGQLVVFPGSLATTKVNEEKKLQE